ncbi:hypothetical protein AXX17_AT1G24590 [Arabidopsis thaliana]|uniref:Transmembrane protein n=1 Tax=Arabidopsis thaliana TaxID=3702 RepID=A0A178WCJ8_ARATH|nr:hypothetical protein AXX17_AT1G24590 [Arabidopsis thaliana]
MGDIGFSTHHNQIIYKTATMLLLYLSRLFCHALWLRCSLGGSYYVSLRHATSTCLLACYLLQ